MTLPDFLFTVGIGLAFFNPMAGVLVILFSLVLADHH